MKIFKIFNHFLNFKIRKIIFNLKTIRQKFINQIFDMKCMFTIEILELLNKYKKSDEYERKKIEENLINIIKNNEDEFLNFAQTKAEELDEETRKFMQNCYDKVEENKKETLPKDTKSDYDIIKNAYEKWLDEFKTNLNVANEKCEQIVEEIINHYALNQLDTLKKIMEIKDDENFESFKNMINNYLRKYFVEKIERYYKSEEYIALGFFKKRSKRKQILNLLNDIGKYEFNSEKIEEVLK